MDVACVLLQVICALGMVNIALAQLALIVDYPDPQNPNLVMLTCTDPIFVVMGAQFQKDGIPLTSGPSSHQVNITNLGIGRVTFTFTQAQEGAFRCIFEGQTSSEIELAGNQMVCVHECSVLYIWCYFILTDVGAPAESYEGTTTLRYLTFPSPDSSRDIELSCPIRPGVLEERYTVDWQGTYPQSRTFILFSNSSFYDFSVNTVPSSQRQFQCRVNIQHRSDLSHTTFYSGPTIIVERKGKDCLWIAMHGPCIHHVVLFLILSFLQ